MHLSDIGSEIIGKAQVKWLDKLEVITSFIEPGSVYITIEAKALTKQ